MSINKKDQRIAELEAEVERLKNFIEKDQGLILKLTGVPVDEYNNKIKSEAYREFAERLCKDRVSNDPVVIAVKVELTESNE